ncbi:MAG: hypothetical protein IK005_11090 [Paludibacteraceae bacterium]|nr:hypothetical protein [Paludibacteraceae bacterium]MBR4841005.1 hypothetical protein [Paludibacteraceae bacterium]
MNIYVNEKKIRIFEGAKVRDAVTRYLSRQKKDLSLIHSAEIQDKEGHTIDLDGSLCKESSITVILKEQ